MMQKWSLRYSLPLFAFGLTAMILILAVLFAGRELRRSATEAADARLARVVEQLASAAATSAEARDRAKLDVGRRSELHALLRGESVGDSVVLGALAPLRMPADSGLPIEVWARDGTVIFRDLVDPAPLEIARDPGIPIIPLDTIPSYGAFFERDGQVHYFSTAPIGSGEQVLGWVVQRRRIGNPRTAADIEPLIGSGSRVLFSYPGDSLWISIAGHPVPAPLRHPPDDTTITFARDGGGNVLVRAKQIRATPWSVLVEMDESAITAAPRMFVRRMLLIGGALLALALALAWLLGRRLTKPLHDLAFAADAMASGDYARRVPVPDSAGEVSRLGVAFNAMAEQVGTSHAALQERLAEAHELASHLERATIAAEEAMADAQRANRAKTDFLAMMSHEIRTPINAVLGYCEVLELDSMSDEARRDFVRRMRRAARQLASLVDDVLDLAKVDAGELRFRPARGMVRHSVDDAVTLLGDEIRRKQLTVETEIDAALAYRADPHRVQQILLNLLSNAVKFTPAGGVITIRATPADPATGGLVRIDVEDTGIGIDADQLERIFEPFVQAQSGYTREYGGSGLGLSISRRLARMMEGDIVASQRPGGGARFSLMLPAVLEAVAAVS